ncbi:unnamed protein product [Toxocara canis]|uniref:Transposase n=1 Tax=Toxocara canis TaxID=6265 RepID=A0A183UGB7_TOXCA|nr:unnamed protein product [Toxocara canis]
MAPEIRQYSDASIFRTVCRLEQQMLTQGMAPSLSKLMTRGLDGRATGRLSGFSRLSVCVVRAHQQNKLSSIVLPS